MTMTAASNTSTRQEIAFQARPTPASEQNSLAGRYSLWVQLLSLAAFSLAFLGWLNESYLFWWDNPIWLNRYTEYAIILGFGIWRIVAERNPYTRKRFIVLVAVVTVFWWLIPWLVPKFEPYIGYLGAQPVFPSLHTPGTLTFFLVLLLVLLFGRRVICGWGCPCVGIRETVGFPFRRITLRSEWAWRLRHSKWFFFVFYAGVMVVSLSPPTGWTASFVGAFYLLVVFTYFGSFFITPVTGNRFYCRYLCPYGATFGLLNHAGFYDIKLDPEKCNDCRRCNQVCDMGIPIWEQGKEHGRVTGLEDCMGCARCVVSCPADALEIRDVRNLFQPALVQNASHFLKKKDEPALARVEPQLRPAQERVRDWAEITQPSTLEDIRAQASRCLDCGVPGCRNACPLANRIPDWLRAAAEGNMQSAAEIAHETSAMPEICGRLCPQHRLCEGGCTLAPGGQAVTIGALEQAITDTALEQGWTPQQPAKRRQQHKVAIVGAGPAGLGCAERLARKGVGVTVYDKGVGIGGLLATGVPPFKLDKTVLARRGALLEEAGVRFELGTSVDERLMGDLLNDNDAVFLGMGAQTPRKVTLGGTKKKGVWQALNFLADANAGRGTDLSGQWVLVLGGGDTAMDSARSALRLGAARVTVAYRRSESEMRASPKEITAAKEESVRFLLHHRPLEIIGNKQTIGMRFAVDNVERIERCDVVILAFGFVPAPPGWLARFAVYTDATGRVVVDESGRTGNPRIYAGGDNVHGPDLVVTALAAGRKAAETIVEDLTLKGRIRRDFREFYDSSPRHAVPAEFAVESVS